MILGTIFGSFGGAIQTGKLGRRYSIMIDSCTFLIATIMLAFSPNFQMVLAARFFQGLFVCLIWGLDTLVVFHAHMRARKVISKDRSFERMDYDQFLPRNGLFGSLQGFLKH